MFAGIQKKPSLKDKILARAKAVVKPKKVKSKVEKSKKKR